MAVEDGNKIVDGSCENAAEACENILNEFDKISIQVAIDPYDTWLGYLFPNQRRPIYNLFYSPLGDKIQGVLGITSMLVATLSLVDVLPRKWMIFAFITCMPQMIYHIGLNHRVLVAIAVKKKDFSLSLRPIYSILLGLLFADVLNWDVRALIAIGISFGDHLNSTHHLRFDINNVGKNLNSHTITKVFSGLNFSIILIMFALGYIETNDRVVVVARTQVTGDPVTLSSASFFRTWLFGYIILIFKEAVSSYRNSGNYSSHLAPQVLIRVAHFNDGTSTQNYREEPTKPTVVSMSSLIID